MHRTSNLIFTHKIYVYPCGPPPSKSAEKRSLNPELVSRLWINQQTMLIFNAQIIKIIVMYWTTTSVDNLLCPPTYGPSCPLKLLFLPSSSCKKAHRQRQRDRLVLLCQYNFFFFCIFYRQHPPSSPLRPSRQFYFTSSVVLALDT